MDRDIILESLEEELEVLVRDYKTVQEQDRVEQDGPTQNKLKRQLKNLGKEITEKEKEIANHKNNSDLDEAKTKIKALTKILI